MERRNVVDTKIYQILTRGYQLIVLNLLMLLFSLPLITIGSVLASGYEISFKMQRHQEKHIAKEFIAMFCKNFKKATISWLIFLLGLSGVFVFSGTIQATLNVGGLVRYLILLLVTVYILAFLYVFPLIGYSENSVKAHFVVGLVMSFKNMGQSILAFLVFACAVVSPLYMPITIILVLFIGISLPVFLNSIIFKKVFEKYQFSSTEEID
ncbi:DUF624 domain-containing protein [Enterococcus sp. LJL90]